LKISMPQKNKHHNESVTLFGELRDLTKFKEDHWQLKITVPEITIYDNLWLTLTDEEIDFLEQEMQRYGNAVQDRATDRLEDIRTAMYKIIDPIKEQAGPPNVSQIVILAITNALLDILECEYVDVEEMGVK